MKLNSYQVYYVNPDKSEVYIGTFRAHSKDEARAIAAEQEGGEDEPVTYYRAE